MNDPRGCSNIENTMAAVIARDKYKDQNSLTSINILKGYVANIVTSFSTNTGLVKMVSESTPKFFGYKKAEFEGK